MLSYFRQNDPFRVIGLLLLLVITRCFFFIFLKDTSVPSASTPLSIEHLFQGTEGLLYGLFQSGLSFLIESYYLNVILASIIVLWNASLINMLLIRNSAFEENTYIPASLYIIFMSSSVDNYFLSAQLLGSSFILLCLIYLQEHLKNRNSDEKVLNIGGTLAVASLFFLPYAWYLLLVLVLFLFYSGTVGRRYLLVIWGFILINLIAWFPLLFLGEGASFWLGYTSGLTLFEMNESFLINLAASLGLPLLIALKTSASNLAGMGMTNVQITVKRVFTWLGIFGVFSVLFLSANSTATANVLILTLSYFVTEHLLNFRRKWFAELTYLSLLALSFLALYFNPIY